MGGGTASTLHWRVITKQSHWSWGHVTIILNKTPSMQRRNTYDPLSCRHCWLTAPCLLKLEIYLGRGLPVHNTTLVQGEVWVFQTIKSFPHLTVFKHLHPKSDGVDMAAGSVSEMLMREGRLKRWWNKEHPRSFSSELFQYFMSFQKREREKKKEKRPVISSIVRKMQTRKNGIFLIMWFLLNYAAAILQKRITRYVSVYSAFGSFVAFCSERVRYSGVCSVELVVRRATMTTATTIKALSSGASGMKGPWLAGWLKCKSSWIIFGNGCNEMVELPAMAA